jgi:hypothetical protein
LESQVRERKSHSVALRARARGIEELKGVGDNCPVFWVPELKNRTEKSMSLTWLIILGICFLIGSSIASAQFLLRSRKSRVITGFLIASITAIVGWTIWVLLPFVGQ